MTYRRLLCSGFLLLSTGLLLLFVSVGCGAELDKALVASSFRSKYRCQSERVSKVAGGYVVEGCGFREEYVCFNSCCDDDVLFEELMFGSDRCVLTRSYRLSHGAAGPVKPSVERRTRETGGYTVLRSTFPTRDARFIVLGAPSEEPHRVLLILRIKPGKDTRENCKLKLIRDGEPVSAKMQSYAESNGVEQLAFVIPSSALKGIGEAKRVVGRVCDHHFEINQWGRDTLALFAVRFREELYLRTR